MSKKTERNLMDAMKRGQDGGHEHPHVGSTDLYRANYDQINWHRNDGRVLLKPKDRKAYLDMVEKELGKNIDYSKIVKVIKA